MVNWSKDTKHANVWKNVVSFNRKKTWTQKKKTI